MTAGDDTVEEGGPAPSYLPSPLLACLSPSHGAALQSIEASFSRQSQTSQTAQLTIKQLQIEWLLQQLTAAEQNAIKAQQQVAELQQRQRPLAHAGDVTLEEIASSDA
jgi:hypothetical protein